MAWAAVIGAAGAVGGALISKNSSKNAAAAQAEANKGDPRISAMLYGDNGQGGLLSRYQGMLDRPQGNALQRFGQANENYLDGAAPGSMGHIRDAANSLLSGTSARMDLPAYAVGNQVQAPGQNNMDLKGSYNSLINGPAGANPFLTGAIQGGINQSSNAFGAMQRDSTKNLMESVMPSIRSNSVLAGQYGGSRQGIAEGRALGDFATEQQRAIGQFGQHNTDAAVSAQAGAYDADRNRQLAATLGLGAQQYGVAQQNAATKNAAEFMNVGNAFDVSKTNAGLDLASKQVGAGLLNGLNANAYNVATNQDNYGLNRATQVNGLLAPYLANNQPQPVAPTGSTAGGALGGAMGALGLYNQFKGGGGGSQFGGSSYGTMSDLFGRNSMFSSGSMI